MQRSSSHSQSRLLVLPAPSWLTHFTFIVVALELYLQIEVEIEVDFHFVLRWSLHFLFIHKFFIDEISVSYECGLRQLGLIIRTTEDVKQYVAWFANFCSEKGLEINLIWTINLLKTILNSGTDSKGCSEVERLRDSKLIKNN